jgi:hypothetical protein
MASQAVALLSPARTAAEAQRCAGCRVTDAARANGICCVPRAFARGKTTPKTEARQRPRFGIKRNVTLQRVANYRRL